MSAAADALMGIFGFNRVEGEQMKTIEETRRELFEAWYRVNQKKCWEESRDCPYLACFEAFNAALDAVVIDFPGLIGLDQPFVGTPISEIRAQNHYNNAIADCRTAIESTGLGLKVKS